jgi:molybdenum cofactor biosynthesis enzyme MoaA
MRPPGVRFSITEKCNYHCFFCHEEGLDMERARQETGDADLYRVIEQLKAGGYEDFTFTGGEPLLKWRQIVRLLAYLRAIDYLPAITIVSNGRALTAEFVDQIWDYPGGIRFNVSMHSLDPVQHHRIVNRMAPVIAEVGDDLPRIQANLALLREAGIPFKLNFVLLKGINTAPAEIARSLDYALAVGARRVKFLELMITKKLKHLYPYYYRLQALRDQLGVKWTPCPGQFFPEFKLHWLR